jgi:hypothetical protein
VVAVASGPGVQAPRPSPAPSPRDGDDDDDSSTDERATGRPTRRRTKQRRSMKNLALSTFTPSPKVSVSTWIDWVDLALQGDAHSGRGKWTDSALSYIRDNMLLDRAGGS